MPKPGIGGAKVASAVESLPESWTCAESFQSRFSAGAVIGELQFD